MEILKYLEKAQNSRILFIETRSLKESERIQSNPELRPDMGVTMSPFFAKTINIHREQGDVLVKNEYVQPLFFSDSNYLKESSAVGKAISVGAYESLVRGAFKEKIGRIWVFGTSTILRPLYLKLSKTPTTSYLYYTPSKIDRFYFISLSYYGTFVDEENDFKKIKAKVFLPAA